MSAELYCRIEDDRRAKWARYRASRGMAYDGPFIGAHPIQECYEEALDALNYLEVAERQMHALPPHIRRPWSCIKGAAYHAEMVARLCLGAMEILREQGEMGD